MWACYSLLSVNRRSTALQPEHSMELFGHISLDYIHIAKYIGQSGGFQDCHKRIACHRRV